MVVMMKGILIVLLVLLLGNVILLYLLAPRLSGRRRVHPFFGVKWAHRGLHDIKKGIPENSIPAFQAAIEAFIWILSVLPCSGADFLQKMESWLSFMMMISEEYAEKKEKWKRRIMPV